MASVGNYLTGTTRFPPEAMTANAANVSGEMFVASASTTWYLEFPFWAFTGVLGYSGNGNQWSTSNNSVYWPSGAYVGAYSTVVDGVTYLGEWLQLQTTRPRIVGAFSITTYTSLIGRGPKDFVIALSNDGVTWTQLGMWTGATYASNVATNFYVSGWTQPAKYFRIIILKTAGDGMPSIDEWKLYEAQLAACPSTCTGKNTSRCSSAGVSVCCSAGQFFVEGTSTACQSCAPGTYTLDGSGTACTGCAAGSNALGAGESCAP